jgi:hypothetical protein
MGDEVEVENAPKYVLILRGLASITGPTYETRVFTSLDEFSEFAARVDVPEEKLIGLYPLGEPLPVAVVEEKQATIVTTRTMSIPEENQ